jgi:hypothetical protein
MKYRGCKCDYYGGLLDTKKSWFSLWRIEEKYHGWNNTVCWPPVAKIQM